MNVCVVVTEHGVTNATDVVCGLPARGGRAGEPVLCLGHWIVLPLEVRRVFLRHHPDDADYPDVVAELAELAAALADPQVLARFG